MTRDPKLWAALAYVFGLISGLLVLWEDRRRLDDRYVRFHAVQSILTFSLVAVLFLLLPTVPVLGDMRPVLAIVRVGVLCLWGLLIYKALIGEAYRLPYIGDLAHTLSSK